MKYVVCVPDGCADEPIPELGGRTPLQVAKMPTLASLARRGEVGLASVIPPGMAPGSDVGNMAILGYDPSVYHTGRAPIEAAAMGIVSDGDTVAFRCNLVTVGEDGTMVDFAGGHPTSEAAAEVIAALDEALGGAGVSFHPGVQYRHIMLAPAAWSAAVCVPPHDLTGKTVVWPQGPGAEELKSLMIASREVLSRFSLEANQIWLWGQGKTPSLPSFGRRWGLSGGLVSEVDLVRGLGVLAGLEVVDVPGATGWYDTDYDAIREAAVRELANGADFFLVHIEATDEAGHAGDLDEKIRALENWDARVLAGLSEALEQLGPWRLLLLPDHPTPVRLRTHTADPVPYLLYDSRRVGAGGSYDERSATGPAVPGHTLLSRLLERAPCEIGE
ncbi:MAG: homoserine kinase [Acidimicrobiales bacterium]|nr:MAG: homoserine kinase [Acidimicrobiales bacterium]